MSKADPAGVLTGAHYLDGDHACCEGAIAAGCRFVAGYPITPSTEVVERIAQRFPRVGDGVFIQMEDEIASSIAIQGAMWGGKKVMTVTSGPGLSLMMEHIGLAAMTEVPCVFVDVQRGGPSTGLPTLPGQADMMQARWGSHGDYETIALCPDSPQEAFDLTFDAFNLAERYRVPVLVMLDECIGHMIEKVVIPPAEELEVVERKWTKKKGKDYLPYEVTDDTMVPDACKAGDGHRIHTTGLTHDERGYPVMNWIAQEKLLRRLVDKINNHVDDIVRYEETNLEGADVAVVTYGITSRVAQRALAMAREQGVKVGMHRLITAWPFPEKRIRELAGKVKAIVVPEMNYGQMVLEVERVVAGKCPVRLVGHGGGMVHEPQVICDAILEVAR
ncbi:MAG: 2-oxoacid:acceptor oxidoreductase subunit alpha [Deltaproteobacteria bacterium]|jgi:2-oxoglutarate ferredoxin oxidoreductase subunit alpha|nr:2-oxoacid:acceptor oxidoreductase subunit alpha [Deltaproteobacteria bacterium]MBW2531678.1 2-oxoacid:acceptor oxidoreductase subunit alpha [Deltaproteobacteria bacterium]